MPTKIILVSPLTLAIAAASLAACKYPYPGDVGDGDAAATCTPSTTTCTDDSLTVCDAAGQPMSTAACAFGCFASGDRCADLEPSNGLAMYLDQARTAAPISIDGIDFDTDAMTVNGASPPFQTAIVTGTPVDIVVIIGSSFEVSDMLAHGRRAVAIVSHGDVRVHRLIAVGVYGLEDTAAGASAPDDPMCTARRGGTTPTTYGGAGGGGYGTAGGMGGAGGAAQGGARGEAIGNDRLEPLHGGCPGAHASGQLLTPTGARAGMAGGALQITTRGVIKLDAMATFSANGGGGRGPDRPSQCPYMPGDPNGCDAGSGGGAGGAILLEAARLDVPASAALTANGGAGTCGALIGVGNGGNGGAGTSPGFNGGDGATSGGGGGGGAGRIRINLPASVSFDPGPPIVSPSPSLGVARTR